MANVDLFKCSDLLREIFKLKQQEADGGRKGCVIAGPLYPSIKQNKKERSTAAPTLKMQCAMHYNK